MSVEYDLVVIGGSLEGIFAAVSAASLNARVALVEQPNKGYWGDCEAIYNSTFSHVASLCKRLEMAVQIGVYQPTPDLGIQLTQVASWAREVNAILSERHSPAILASLGIDIIRGSGEFCRLPRQAFVVGDKKLRSRKYMIATGSHFVIPDIKGIEAVGYLTPNDLWQEDKLESLPFNLAIVGESPVAIQLAQNFSQIGRSVALVVEDRHLLSTEDLEAARLIQAQLEASGVEILLESPVTQVLRIEEKKWLQAGDRAIEADEIILVGKQKANVEGLNLEGVGVRVDDRGIQLNEKLQTTNPRIYACGSVAGGYSLTHVARYEASIALKNALFLPLLKVDYRTIPYVMFTNPPLARVGMTEAQAKRRYGKDVWVVKQDFKASDRAQLLGETTGFCKLVIQGNGEILGAHVVGAQAGELIGAIALMIKNKIKLGSIANISFPWLTFSEIFQKLAFEWQSQRFKTNKTLQNCLENLFICLRNFSS
jgi:pyruvate/2-oxoglutarate dehydrogenase complex dihydrolipoamide dehydrogenase (E3) component